MGGAGTAWQAEGAEDLFDCIGAFLAEHRLSADPEHYSFVHAILSQPDTAMALEVGRLAEGGFRLTREDIERLGGSVTTGGMPVSGALAGVRGAERVIDSGIDEGVERLAAETRTQVDGFARLMRTMQHETRGFGHDLAQGVAAISHREPLPGTRDVVRIAGAMIERVRASEAKLARATDEVEALRTKLAEARETARRDPLTGLGNRLAFAERFTGRDPAAAPHCVALCDIDRFKRINDDFGHGVGDRVLKAIGRALADSCAGHLVARHGGEEFTVLMAGIDLASAAALLDTARATVAAKRFRDRETEEALGSITFSAGVTAIRADEPVEQAIDRADRLLYTAKTQGRDRVCTG